MEHKILALEASLSHCEELPKAATKQSLGLLRRRFAPPRNDRGQGTLEAALVIVIVLLLLGGIMNIWVWANNQIVGRQANYNATRVLAGTSADNYTLRWPVYRPQELGEERVLPNAQ